MKSGGNLKSKAYKAIERNMIDKFGADFTVEKIKNKLTSTKADFNVCKQILSTSGFGWDPTNKCVEVDNEVWAEYIQKFPDRRKFKGGQKWKHYQQLEEVYGQSTATGSGSINCIAYMRTTNNLEINEVPQTPMYQMPDMGYNYGENVSFTQMLNGESPVPSPTPVPKESQPSGNESRATNSSNKRARLSTNQDDFGTLMHEIADSFQTMINTSTNLCLNKCLDILEEMLDSGDIDDAMHIKATMLVEQGNKAIVFLRLRPTQQIYF
ncbi:hypothetical protein EJ110_NYTH46714 [Nymphaea thermarum]|nr:hypothetical protein EJ110_NYTH46714 [Nymphaea thermarum]